MTVLTQLFAGLVLLGSGGFLGGYNLYVLFMNRTNHTGLPVRGMMLVWFVACIVVLGFLELNRLKGWGEGWLLGLALVACLLSAVNLGVFDYANVMMNYQDWHTKGKPPRPPLEWPR